MHTFLLALAVSFVVTLLIVRFGHWVDRFIHDHDVGGVQKFHVHPVPRIGGVGIMLALVAVSVLLFLRGAEISSAFVYLLTTGSALPDAAIPPRIQCLRQSGRLVVQVDLCLPSSPSTTAPEKFWKSWQLGLSAVLESRAGDLSYWALSHPDPERPDFHDRRGHSLTL